uniref:Uncharacterized protein n=1 Tax=Triticum urartu TaxID=4572 RepID=A0A8R7PPT2_TRIUA
MIPHMRRKMMMMMATDMDTCIHMGCFLRQCRPLIQLMMLKFSMALALHTYGMFPPSMLSSNPVNDAEVFNGFGMQSHPNVENRSLGCNEGVVYEEALQQDLIDGVPLLKDVRGSPIIGSLLFESQGSGIT